jgi:hypothetical protein
MVSIKKLSFYLFILLFFSCSSNNGKFRLEGRMRNMNNSEFMVYSPDGGIMGIDTIPVRNSRFSYETELLHDATLIIVFPNYSEQPVFAQAGQEVSVKGDASHLKDIRITGTDDNDEYTELRLKLNSLMPPDIPNAVEQYIREQPLSPVSRYLLTRYFLLTPNPDYKKAAQLNAFLLKQMPDNEQLKQQQRQIANLQGGATGSRLPRFSATDVKGRRVTDADMKGKVGVVSVWASWNYRSTEQLRTLQRLKKKHGDQLAVVSTCIDARPADCKKRVERDSLSWPVICDGRLWKTPLLTKFGFADVPSNIVVDAKGRIIARNLASQQLESKVNELLK